MGKRNQHKKGRKTYYSVSFMRQVVRDMKSEGLTLSEVQRKYNLSSRTIAGGWYSKYSSDIEVLNTYENMEDKKNTEVSGEKEREVEELKGALERANMKITALETMIDMAEQEFNIAVRKNSDTKQSKK